MERDDILAQMKHIMKQTSQEKVDWEAVTMDTPISSLGFDSLSILDLVYDIQQSFHVEFEAESLAGVKTAGQLVDFLKSKMG